METFRRARLDFDELKARAQRRGFRAVRDEPDRVARARHAHRAAHDLQRGRRVCRGAQRSANETVIYSAHWDHLGRCPAIDGDDICNGALDNATGDCGADRTGAPLPRRRAARALGGVHRLHRRRAGPARRALLSRQPGVSGAQHGGGDQHGRHQQCRAAPTTSEIVGYGKSEMDDLITGPLAAQGRRVAPGFNAGSRLFLSLRPSALRPTGHSRALHLQRHRHGRGRRRARPRAQRGLHRQQLSQAHRRSDAGVGHDRRRAGPGGALCRGPRLGGRQRLAAMARQRRIPRRARSFAAGKVMAKQPKMPRARRALLEPQSAGRLSALG